MIEPNIGTLERAGRAFIGIFLAIYIWQQPSMGLLEWVGAICSLFLILNAITSRCYLWKLLGIDSCDDEYGDCKGKTPSC